jgi:hypothetical protein
MNRHDPDVSPYVQHHGVFRKEPEEVKEVAFPSVKLQAKDLENGKNEKVIIESKDLLQIFLDGVFHLDKYIIYSLITFKLHRADIFILEDPVYKSESSFSSHRRWRYGDF